MAATIPYWRVLFYPEKPELISSINVAKLVPQDAGGVDIGGSPTLSATKQHDAIGYPLSNILDGVGTTYAVLAWGATETDPASIGFQYALPTSVDRFLIRFNSTDTVYGTRLASNKVHILVQFSWNGTEWTTSATVGIGVSAGNTDLTIPAVRSSELNPWIVHLAEQGAGGIYGVVSEDGTAASGYPVAAFSRTSMQRVAYTTSESDGGYALNGLNPDNEYLVLAVDPTGPSPKNAIVWDRVKPIPSTKYLPSDDRFLAHRLRDPYLGPTMAMSDHVPAASPFVVPYGGFNTYVGTSGTAIQDSYEIFRDIQMFDLEIRDTSNVSGLNFLARTDYASPLTPGNGGLFGGGVHPSVAMNIGTPDDNPLNYNAFTYELVVVTPTIGEAAGGLLLQLGGPPAEYMDMSNVAHFLHSYLSSDGSVYRRSIVLDFRDGNLNFRGHLGGYNAATVRATVALTPATPHHIVITYEGGVEVKIYVNGVLAVTGSIFGAGRLYSAATGSDNAGTSTATWELNNEADFNNYGQNPTTPQASYSGISGPLGYINQFNLRTFNYGTQHGYFYASDTSWGGCLAFFATYFGVKDLAAVEDLYDSYQNPTGFQVLPTQVGYSAQVEVDNPVQYYPLSEPAPPSSGLRCAVGRKDLPVLISGSDGYLGAAGNFAAGKTSWFNPLASHLYSNANPGVGVPFTFECFFRAISLNFCLLAFEGPGGYNDVVHLCVDADGYFLSELRDIGGTLNSQLYSVNDADTINVDTTYHLAFTYDPISSGEANVYINGALVSSLVAAIYPDMQGILRMRLGQDGAGDRTFKGYLGEVALYGHVLTADRVAAHYAARND